MWDSGSVECRALHVEEYAHANGTMVSGRRGAMMCVELWSCRDCLVAARGTANLVAIAGAGGRETPFGGMITLRRSSQSLRVVITMLVTSAW